MLKTVTISVRIPQEWFDELEKRNVDKSKLIRKLLEKYLYNKEHNSIQTLSEINELKNVVHDVLQRLQQLEEKVTSQLKAKELEEQETLITLLKEEFSDLDIKTHLQEGTQKEKLKKWCMDRIKQLAAKTRATEDELFELACEYIIGLKEVL